MKKLHIIFLLTLFSGFAYGQQFGNLKVGNNTTISGRLGIGVLADTIPNEFRMGVNGKILATGVEVFFKEDWPRYIWPDYVFTKEYKLMPLNEVKKYIQENKHLPAVPSADEIGNKGYNLTDMDAKLLEKIEELTLHMIRLDEENKKLKAELDQIKSKK